jgi:hypothetical protein
VGSIPAGDGLTVLRCAISALAICFFLKTSRAKKYAQKMNQHESFID